MGKLQCHEAGTHDPSVCPKQWFTNPGPPGTFLAFLLQYRSAHLPGRQHLPVCNAAVVASHVQLCIVPQPSGSVPQCARRQFRNARGQSGSHGCNEEQQSAVTSHLETQLQKWSGAVQDSVVTFIPGAASYTARLGTGWHDAERASSKT